MRNKERDDLDRLVIVGFRLHYANDTPELYTLFVEEEKDRAATQDDSLLFVTSLDDISSIYSVLDSRIKDKFPMPTEMESGIDVAKTLYLLENESNDDDAAILECLNATFDLFNSIDLAITAERRKVLYELADFLTFADNFSDYLEERSINRRELIDHLVWCYGKLLTRSRIL